MAQVFISYSSADRDLARVLAERLARADIGGQPLSVWWDRELVAGDDYWRKIETALDDSAAVVVLWSDSSTASDWVYSEANRATKVRKLVAVSLTGRLNEPAPMPFDVLHTVPFADPVADLPAILAGIEARLARRPWRIATGRKASELDQDVLEMKRDPMPDDAALAPGDLLKARNQHGVIDYVDTHGLAADFVAWANRPPAEALGRSALARLVHAAGGFGKTRLMIEVVARLQSQGWLAGFVPRGFLDTPREAVLQRLIDHGTEASGLLLVVDYVEQRTAEAAWLAERLAARAGADRRPARLVMLSRGAGPWWDEWLERTTPLQRLVTIEPARADAQATVDVRRIPDTFGRGDRLGLFDTAHASFCRRTASVAAAQPPISDALVALIEHDPRYARPLALQMAALLLAYGYDPASGGTDIADLLGKILGLERDHWERALTAGDAEPERRALTPQQRETIARATAQATLLQSIAGRDGACDLIGRDPLLARSGLPLSSVHEMMSKLYPRDDGGLAPLEPDLLGEHHVARVADDGLVTACLDAVGDGTDKRDNILTVLVRATRPEHGATAATNAVARIERLIRERAELVPALLGVMAATPGGLIDRLADDTLTTLADALPHQTLALMSLAITLTEQQVARARAKVAEAPRHLDSDTKTAAELSATSLLSSALNNLGVRLGNAGRREDALAAAQEAVALRRDLARDRPDAFTADLAMSLNNLANMLADLGRREDALAAAQEAAALRRDLARDRPDAFTPSLATSFNNLANMLAALGRREDALAAAQEAADLYRDLARERPDAFTADLAMSLNNLATMLSDLGRREDALAAAQEAVALRRDLARDRPDAFNPDLAMSLNNLATMLSDLGRREDALAAAQEAADLYRDLARDRPDAFTPSLAMSLGALSQVHAGAERYVEAATAAGEGLAIIAPLVEALPEAFRGLAGALARDYIAACEKAGTEPDMALLTRVAAALGLGQEAAEDT